MGGAWTALPERVSLEDTFKLPRPLTRPKVASSPKWPANPFLSVELVQSCCIASFSLRCAILDSFGQLCI